MTIPQSRSIKTLNYFVRLFLTVFILVSSYINIHAQIQSKVDSIIGLQNPPMDTILAWLDNHIDADIKDFRPVSNMALQYAYETKDPNIIAVAHELLASWHAYNGFFPVDSTLYHSKKVVYNYRLGSDSIKVANALKSLSLDYINNSQNEEALKIIFQALRIFEDNNDQAGAAGVYKNLASLYAFSKDGEKTIEYANKAIAILENTEDYYTLSITYLYLIQGYTQLDKYDEALEAAKKCLDISKEIPDQMGIPLRAHSWSYETYIKMGEFDLAYEEAVIAWNIAKNAVGEERAAGYRSEIGNSLMLQGKVSDALPHLRASVDLIEAQETRTASLPYDLLAQCYEKLGQYQNALKYYKVVADIDKKNLVAQVANLKSESVIKYETDKKDQELILQQARLKQKTTVQMLMAAFLGILALSLFLLFSSFRKNKKTSEKLEIKNQENELLLKEIHHRVKNNLQTISSLLNLQSESIKDEAAYDAVQESKNRVASMALIHQKLYQGENLAAIEMKDYFETIGNAVKESFGEKVDNISLEIEMPELELDVDTAVPIGLITNELLTNALKYAYPDDLSGTIKIKMTKTTDNLIQLEISDDGVGMNNESENQGFGTLLVQLLTTQLGGTLEKKHYNGTSIILLFKEQEKSVA